MRYAGVCWNCTGRNVNVAHPHRSPHQVFDNIAYIVLSEMAPGAASFSTWTGVIHAVDFVCCGLILLPIFWSVHHLRQAAEADGKGTACVDQISCDDVV